jgi:hypothetical protein
MERRIVGSSLDRCPQKRYEMEKINNKKQNCGLPSVDQITTNEI